MQILAADITNIIRKCTISENQSPFTLLTATARRHAIDTMLSEILRNEINLALFQTNEVCGKVLEST